MSAEASDKSNFIIWEGKPWIFPRLMFRSITIFVVFLAFLWLEIYLDIALQGFQQIPIGIWTGFLFILIWIISILNLLWIKASNKYILRNESLEITTGVITIRVFVIVPSGFANMEVIQTLISRILNTGDIIIRTQDEPYGDKKMAMVQNAENVADKIRNVMSKPMARLEK